MKLNEIGDFLKSLRKSKGYTQANLAEMLNVSNKSVSKWETGSGLPEMQTLLELAKIYEVTVDEILRGTRNQQKSDVNLKERKEYLIKNRVQSFYTMTLVYSLVTMIGFVLLLIIGSFYENTIILAAFLALFYLTAIVIQIISIKNILFQIKDNSMIENNEFLIYKIWNACFWFFSLVICLICLTFTYQINPDGHVDFNAYLNRLVFVISALFVFIIEAYIIFRLVMNHFKYYKKLSLFKYLVFGILLVSSVSPFIYQSINPLSDPRTVYMSFEKSIQPDGYERLRIIGIVRNDHENEIYESDQYTLVLETGDLEYIDSNGNTEVMSSETYELMNNIYYIKDIEFNDNIAKTAWRTSNDLIELDYYLELFAYSLMLSVVLLSSGFGIYSVIKKNKMSNHK